MLEEYITNEYARALVVLFLVFVSIRILIFILGRVLPKLTAKTKTTLDDEIIKKASMPLSLVGFFVGTRFAIGQITLQESLRSTIEGMILTGIVIFTAWFIYSIVDALILIGFRDLSTKVRGKKANESLTQFFHSLAKIIVIIGTFLAILAAWGVEIGPLLAGLGVAGIAIAFALQSTLSNIFGGISMIFDKSINVGDQIKLEDGTMGIVTQVNLRSTKIRTFDNELIIVPNGKLSEGNIQNIALPEPKTRVVVPFGVEYGSNIEKVKKIVLQEVVKINHMIMDPAPSVKFLEMANSSLNFKAYFYVDTYENRLTAIDEANTRIYNALNKNKIGIPFPQMDVHLKKK